MLPQGITVGPDGNLWFTENGNSKIGSATTDGGFQDVATPTASAGPQEITLGPDGNLWFTEVGPGINKIGKVGARHNALTARVDLKSDRKAGVLRVQAGRLDDAYLDHWAADLGVADLLAKARAQAHIAG